MGVELKLTAGNATEQLILDYLLANASDVLAEKINAGTKTLAGALRYCKDEARKMKGSGDMVCVDDATVFGWVIHYFEEAALDEEDEPKAAAKETSRPAPKEKASRPARKARKAKEPEAPADDHETPADQPQPAQDAAPAAPEAKPAPAPVKPVAEQLPLFAAVLHGGHG